MDQLVHSVLSLRVLCGKKLDYFFLRYFRFGKTIADKITTTPIHLKNETCSCNTKPAIITATGSSAALNIELMAVPIRGTPSA